MGDMTLEEIRDRQHQMNSYQEHIYTLAFRSLPNAFDNAIKKKTAVKGIENQNRNSRIAGLAVAAFSDPEDTTCCFFAITRGEDRYRRCEHVRVLGSSFCIGHRGKIKSDHPCYVLVALRNAHLDRLEDEAINKALPPPADEEEDLMSM